MSYILENTDVWAITVSPKTGITLHHKPTQESVFLQGDDVAQFETDYGNMQSAYGNPESVWHKETWNRCLAELCGEYISVGSLRSRRLPSLPVWFFAYFMADQEVGGGIDYAEITESCFLKIIQENNGIPEYKRHTVRENGVGQVCLTISPDSFIADCAGDLEIIQN